MAIRFRLDAGMRLLTFVVISIALLRQPRYTEGAKIKCHYCVEKTTAKEYDNCIKGGTPNYLTGSGAGKTEDDCEKGCVTVIEYSADGKTITGAAKGCLDGFPAELMDCVKASCGQKGDCVTITAADSDKMGTCKSENGNVMFGRSYDSDIGAIDYLGLQARAQTFTNAKICKCNTDKCNEKTPDTSKMGKYECSGSTRISAELEGRSMKLLGIGMVAIKVFVGH